MQQHQHQQQEQEQEDEACVYVVTHETRCWDNNNRSEQAGLFINWRAAHLHSVKTNFSSWCELEEEAQMDYSTGTSLSRLSPEAKALIKPFLTYAIDPYADEPQDEEEESEDELQEESSESKRWRKIHETFQGHSIDFDSMDICLLEELETYFSNTVDCWNYTWRWCGEITVASISAMPLNTST